MSFALSASFAATDVVHTHGLADAVYGGSSMDFADEEGFDTYDGAMNLWNEAIDIYNWNVNGVAG